MMAVSASHVGRDQYGTVYWLARYPRQELCRRLGRSHIDKLYSDNLTGRSRHIGYVIAGLWIEIQRLAPLEAGA